MKCPRCDGLGRLVRLSVEDADARPIDLLGSTDESRIKFAPCPVCDGTGNVDKKRQPHGETDEGS